MCDAPNLSTASSPAASPAAAPGGWRRRLAPSLESRGGAALVAVGLSALIVLPALADSPLGTFTAFGVAVAYTSLRERGWWRLGIRRPTRGWPATLALGVVLGTALMLVTTAIVDPLLARALGAPVDLSSFSSLEGDLALLLFWLSFVWLVVVLLEEVLFRGVLFDAFRRAVGGASRGTRDGGANQRRGGLAAVASSLVFGLAHAYQGITGIASTAFAGLVLVAIYRRGGGDLWLPIIVHGVVNTLALLLLFAGAYRAVEGLFF